MKKENDELTNLFRTRLQDVEMPVREGFWEALQEDIPVVISRRRQIIHRFSAAASVLLILAGASAAFWYFSPKEEIANAFTQVAVSTGTSGKMGADIVHGELPDFHASSTSPVPVASKPSATVEEYEEEETFSVSISMSFSISSSSNTDAQNHTSGRYNGQAAYAGSPGPEAGQPGLTNVDLRYYADGVQDDVSPVENNKHRTWSAGAFASAGLLNAHAQSVKYKQPFSLGLTVRKELSDRWGIESGLVYSQLNSELTINEGGSSTTQDQTLHYVGIPVKADLNLYKNKRVNLYAAAGGMVEKCVSGDVKPNELQLSLTAAVGVQYKLSDRLSLYAEPGLSYHFDDGGPVTTIRKEKPLNMNLLCGVRMTY